MSNFVENLARKVNYNYTDNGAYCLDSTGSKVLDFYATIGALRCARVEYKYELFDKAVAENKLLAAKALFYGRDVREGLGERQTFRDLLHYAADRYPEMVIPNIPLIGFYGRFDDLYCLVDTKCADAMWFYMRSMFNADLVAMHSGKPVSLLAKWIKTPDASSRKTRALGVLTSSKLGYSNVKAFKKDLKALRRYLDIVEIKVSANNLAAISYERVPSNAMLKYRNLFATKDEERFFNYLENVTSGKAKINTNTLYPYDIVKKFIDADWDLVDDPDNAVLDTLWNALPNYVEDGSNILVVADVSGSMFSCGNLPISSSIGLAIYFAERCKGDFHNKFMTFSSRPKLVDVCGVTLVDKIRNVADADWGMSTNLAAVFEEILNTAKENNTPAEDLPKAIVIISDMQIDCLYDNDKIIHETYKEKFAVAGYEIPNVIFWNVNSQKNTFHASAENPNVQYLSGHSATSFKTLINGLGKKPIEAMLEVLLGDRYVNVTVA